jgi:eukaryotic-like serine/threonine-protein kinase
MAHYSYLSPDRHIVLISEMDRTNRFQSCRVVPFEGGLPGRQVGPNGACGTAAWSPDGRSMYFSATVDGASHLWRQRFPDGQPEQVTFGPTEEMGVEVTPDGQSLVTSLGQRRSAIWIRDEQGERQISIEGVAFAPRLSANGRRLYYPMGAGGVLPGSFAQLVAAAQESVQPGTRIIQQAPFFLFSRPRPVDLRVRPARRPEQFVSDSAALGTRGQVAAGL